MVLCFTVHAKLHHTELLADYGADCECDVDEVLEQHTVEMLSEGCTYILLVVF